MSAESPMHVRTSLAAAMTLDFKPGLFYRDARSPCVNLLLTYDDGCAGSCAYCGLSNKRQGNYGSKSFIRVGWPTYQLREITDAIALNERRVKRVCVSMITNPRARADTCKVIREIKDRLDIPVSVLLAPTILNKRDLAEIRACGADMAGVAIDCATPVLFEKYRGKGVGGPHRWERYWQCFEESVEIFGEGMAGVHLIVGMDETEKEMAAMIQTARDKGGSTHLFSFFPEAGSQMAEGQPPAIGHYRRIQLARYLIDEGIGNVQDFIFDNDGRLTGYGLSGDGQVDICRTGEPFKTSGCQGRDGRVACNRPYANCLPGPIIRNYPFQPDEDDLDMIMKQLWS